MVPYAVVEWLSKKMANTKLIEGMVGKNYENRCQLQKRVLRIILRIFNGGSTDGPKR